MYIYFIYSTKANNYMHFIKYTFRFPPSLNTIVIKHLSYTCNRWTYSAIIDMQSWTLLRRSHPLLLLWKELSVNKIAKVAAKCFYYFLINITFKLAFRLSK